MEAYNTTKQLLLAAEVPQSSRTYKAISHEQLIDLTLNSIVGAGFKLESELYNSAREGNVANGRYIISDVADSEMKLQIGWQNSYDKSLSAKFALGVQIIICSNGCVRGDFGTFKKKHQGSIQEFVPSAITEYIKQSGEVFAKMQTEREEMKKIEISRKTKAELLGRLFADDKIITSTQLGIIAREIEAPTFQYSDAESMWSMYNYATFAAKEVHPTFWMQQHMNLHKFFVNEAGILVENRPTITVPENEYHISPNQLPLFDTNAVG